MEYMEWILAAADASAVNYRTQAPLNLRILNNTAHVWRYGNVIIIVIIIFIITETSLVWVFSENASCILCLSAQLSTFMSKIVWIPSSLMSYLALNLSSVARYRK